MMHGQNLPQKRINCSQVTRFCRAYDEFRHNFPQGFPNCKITILNQIFKLD